MTLTTTRTKHNEMVEWLNGTKLKKQIHFKHLPFLCVSLRRVVTNWCESRLISTRGAWSHKRRVYCSNRQQKLTSFSFLKKDNGMIQRSFLSLSYGWSMYDIFCYMQMIRESQSVAINRKENLFSSYFLLILKMSCSLAH